MWDGRKGGLEEISKMKRKEMEVMKKGLEKRGRRGTKKGEVVG